MMRTRPQYYLGVATAVVIAHVAFAVWASSAHAYATWSDGCVGCHGDFNSGTYVSQRDGTSWGTNLMSGHSGFMGSGTCNVCHQPPAGTPRAPVFIGLSAGITGYSPISCLGCHGRAADASGGCVTGDSATINPANCGMGAGLRLHHASAGITECGDCHADSSAVAESVSPVYYFTPDTAHPNKPTNPCNSAATPGNENKFGLSGLDNDGDGLYDQSDPDCAVTAETDAACFDGTDNDANGATDCADSGCAGATGGAQTTCGVGACEATGNQICADGVAVPNCTPGIPRAEVCNNLDDDCDGAADNIVPVACAVPGQSGPCANGQTACQGGALVCLQGVQPSAEICDGIDNDCDGTVDNISPAACTVPGQSGPCANGETACQGGVSICQQTVQPVPEAPPGGALCQDGIDNDCDATIDAADAGCQFAGEANCFDGLDNNGDGQIDCADATCASAIGPDTTCGVGACAAHGHRVCLDGAEVDTCVAGIATAEVCDALDNDCDGVVDNSISPVAITCGTGACQASGQRVCVSGQLVDQCIPGQPLDEVCNNVDDDCDGTIDNLTPVPTSCGIGACANTGALACQNGEPVDTCTPLPAATEGPFTSPTCADTIDNDCDGTTDAEDAGCAVVCVPQAEVCDGVDNDCNGEIDDGIVPITITCGVGLCRNTGERVCLNGALADQCTPLPPGQEGPFGDASCADGIDNNCDGLADAADPNCQPVCVPAEEVCDGVDNDCNDVIDDVPPLPTTCGMGACANSGELVCQNGVLIDICTPLPPGVEQFGVADSCADNVDNDCDALVDAADPGCTAPPVEQACFDGLDNDADGLVDCADPDCADANDGPCDTGFAGACAAGAVHCVGGAAACVQLVFPQPEFCTDGLDNDCDGLTDAADPDCQHVQVCHVPGNSLTKVKVITIGPDALPAHLRHGDFWPDPSGTCQQTARDGGVRGHGAERGAGKD